MILFTIIFLDLLLINRFAYICIVIGLCAMMQYLFRVAQCVHVIRGDIVMGWSRQVMGWTWGDHAWVVGSLRINWLALKHGHVFNVFPLSQSSNCQSWHVNVYIIKWTLNWTLTPQMPLGGYIRQARLGVIILLLFYDIILSFEVLLLANYW
jgi:hypothetical protein